MLETIEDKTEAIADDVETIKLQNELERIDREWMMSQEKYMVRGKDGHYSIPSSGGSVVMMVIAVGFGFFWMVTAASMGGGQIAIFGLVFIAVAVISGIRGLTKATAYQHNKQQYEHRRQQVVNDLHSRDR